MSTPNRSRRDDDIRRKLALLPVHLAAEQAADDPDNRGPRPGPDLKAENARLILLLHAAEGERAHFASRAGAATDRALLAEARLARAEEERDAALRERDALRRAVWPRPSDRALARLGALEPALRRLATPAGVATCLAPIALGVCLGLWLGAT